MPHHKHLLAGLEPTVLLSTTSAYGGAAGIRTRVRQPFGLLHRYNSNYTCVANFVKQIFLFLQVFHQLIDQGLSYLSRAYQSHSCSCNVLDIKNILLSF